MKEHLSSVEADDRLLPLLEQVATEGAVTITRAGQAVAKIVAVQTKPTMSPREAADRLLALRDEIASRGETFSWEELKQWRDEGRP